MLGGPPPLVSVPAAELSPHPLSGSVVPLAEVRKAPVSPELSLALDLLQAQFGEAAGWQVVVRPEMFTHGAALAWLRDRIGNADAHLCLSDGEAVRVVPGLANHVFFYRAGSASSHAGLARLRRRAPELLATIETQVNTAFAFSPDDRVQPRTTILPKPMAADDQAVFLPFCTPRGQVNPDAQLLLSQNAVTPAAASRLTYVMVSDAALRSVPFVCGLVNTIVEACRRADMLLVIGAPLAATAKTALQQVLEAIYSSDFNLPSGVPANVFVQFGDAALPPALFQGDTCLVAHEDNPFWRRRPDFYTPFGAATVLRERKSLHHAAGLFDTLVRLTDRRWEYATLPDPDETPLSRYVL